MTESRVPRPRLGSAALGPSRTSTARRRRRTGRWSAARRASARRRPLRRRRRAWAAWSFFATGPQPAEALPDSTIAYASIDLDPSGGQKIEALQTLKKFPAFEDEVGLDTDDDIREVDLRRGPGAPAPARTSTTPTTSSRGSATGSPSRRSTPAATSPAPVFVVQVTDEDAADAGLEQAARLRAASDDGAWAIADGWALVGRDAGDRRTASRRRRGRAARRRRRLPALDRRGRRRRASSRCTLAPEAGELLADQLDELTGLGGLDEARATPTARCSRRPRRVPRRRGVRRADRRSSRTSAGRPRPSASTTGRSSSRSPRTPGDRASVFAGAGGAGDLVGSLPEDTAAALGVGLGRRLVRRRSLDAGRWSRACCEAREPGSTCPRTPRPCSARPRSLAIGGDFDPEALFDPDGSEDVPVGAQGPRRRGRDRGRCSTGSSPASRTSCRSAVDSDGDLVAIGPDADYREQLLEDGGLGDTDVFRDAVPDADDADAILFVDFDAGDWLDQLADADEEVAENLAPLAALGMSAWHRRRHQPRWCCGSRPTDRRPPVAPVDPDQVGRRERRGPGRAGRRRRRRCRSRARTRRGRSGAGASGRPGRCRRRRTRWPARPRRPRPSRPCCRPTARASALRSSWPETGTMPTVSLPSTVAIRVLNTRAGSRPSASAASSPNDAARGSWSYSCSVNVDAGAGQRDGGRRAAGGLLLRHVSSATSGCGPPRWPAATGSRSSRAARRAAGR